MSFPSFLSWSFQQPENQLKTCLRLALNLLLPLVVIDFFVGFLLTGQWEIGAALSGMAILIGAIYLPLISAVAAKAAKEKAQNC